MAGRIARRAAAKLVAAARKAGLDATRLPRVPGLDSGPPGAGDPHIPLTLIYDLWEAIMHAVDDPGFPLQAATEYEIADYELLGFLCLTCRTLGDALEAMVRYYKLWKEGPCWQVEYGGTAMSLVYRVPEHIPGHAPGHLSSNSSRQRPAAHCLGIRCDIESTFAQIVLAARRVTTRPLRPIEVRFRHRAPGNISAHLRLFEAPVRFQTERTELLFDTPLLATPLVKAEPRLSAYLQQHAERLVARLSSSSSVTEQIKTFVRGALPRGEATLEAAAAHAGLSTRALRGQLAHAGTTFRKLIDETRLELARHYLENSRTSIEEIASTLGFSEPSAFYRAFKRWTGLTPRQFRKQLS